MKKIFYFIAVLFCFTAHSQNPTCGSDELMKSMTKKDPGLASRIDEMDVKLNSLFQHRILSKVPPNPPMITIPVAIMVIHDGSAYGTGCNIDDTQIANQMTALNSYFNPYGIRFCIATNYNTTGATTPGLGTSQPNSNISHYTSALTNHNAMTDQAALVNTMNTQVTYQKYLRIWIVKSISGLPSGTLGYSMFPNSSSVFDGVVIRHDVFGNGESTLVPDYDQGKTLVHEIGHYLGLYHTFYEGCLGGDAATCSLSGDRVCDTPQGTSGVFGCPITAPDTCPLESPTNLPDPIHNYMNYVHDYCMNEFSPGQVQRMKDILAQYRRILYSTDNLIYTGTCGASSTMLTASFSASSYSVCTTSAPVTFYPVVTQNATYLWDFGDGTATSSLMNPTHSFTSSTNSPYTVTLTIVRGTESLVSTVKIYVKSCSQIQSSDGNWYTSLNNMLNFSSGVPVASSIPTANSTGEAATVQSNPQGTLLFYSNGAKIYNSSDVALNSTNLSSDTSAKEGVISIPTPGSTTQYYLFTRPSTGGLGGLRYSIINISGTTPSLSATVNQAVTIPSSNGYSTGTNGAIIGSEGIAAAQHCSGYWIVTTGVKSNGEYLMVYNLTSSGLAFVSETLLPASSVTTATRYLSAMKFSPDGNRLLFYRIYDSPNIYLYDFNKFTGASMSAPIAINDSSATVGVSFSPNSKLLYINNMSGRICQYNCTSSNISNTKKRIDLIDFGGVGSLQIGPDGKIYGTAMSSNTLFTIHNPNGLITDTNPNACEYARNGVRMVNNISYALPNLIDAKLATAFPSTGGTISYYAVNCNNYKFFPNISCSTAITWNFGDGTTSTATIPPTHNYAVDGNYNVTIKNSSNVIIASTTVTVGMTAPSILGSSAACAVSEYTNTTTNSVILQPGQNAVWSITGGTGNIRGLNNQTEVIIQWDTLPGIISLTITDANGCSRTFTKNIIKICSCQCFEENYFTTSITNNFVQFFVANDYPLLCPTAYGMKWWDFGDGTGSSDESPIHQYSAVGVYTVTLLTSATQCGEYYENDVEIDSMDKKAGQTISGISGNNPENLIKLYPNPTSSTVNISLNLEFDTRTYVSLRTIEGKLLFSESWNLLKGNNDIEFMLPSNIAKGTYLVEINNSGTNTVKRLIVE